jgi:hypothetical protein
MAADFIAYTLQVNLKNLDGLEIDAPSPSRSGQVGSLSRKGTVYNIWSMGDEDTEFAGAEELRGLSCLLPRRKKSGKLYMGKSPLQDVIRMDLSVPQHPKKLHAILLFQLSHQTPPLWRTRPFYTKIPLASHIQKNHSSIISCHMALERSLQ